MVSLIINADDFGFNEGRTKAILEFIRKGLVTNTTLMVNMPYAEQAADLAKREGLENIVGLHLNLTEGRPLTKGLMSEPLFCDADGRFNRRFHLSAKTRIFLPARTVAHVGEELKAQLEKYLALGMKEMHLDSHHHAHTDFAISQVLLPLALKMGFKSIRLSANMPIGGRGIVKTAYKWLFNRSLRQFRTVDYFGGVREVCENGFRLGNSVVEVMTHPIRCEDGFCSPEPSDVGDYETKASELRGLLEAMGGFARLFSYDDWVAKA